MDHVFGHDRRELALPCQVDKDVVGERHELAVLDDAILILVGGEEERLDVALPGKQQTFD